MEPFEDTYAKYAEERARQGRQPPPPLQELLKNDEMVSSGTFWHSLFHNNPSSSAGKTKEAMMARVIPGFTPAPPPGPAAILTPAQVEAYNAQGFLAVEQPLLTREEAARHGDLWQAIRDAHVRDSIGPMLAGMAADGFFKYYGARPPTTTTHHTPPPPPPPQPHASHL